MVARAHAQFDSHKDSRCWRIKILIPTATSKDWVSGHLLHEMIHLQLKDDPTEQSDNPHFHGAKFKARAAELKQLTGYENIEDVHARAEQMIPCFQELMRRQSLK